MEMKLKMTYVGFQRCKLHETLNVIYLHTRVLEESFKMVVAEVVKYVDELR